MNKQVFLNSFHSHSIPILEEYSPEAIISFDSHLDDFLECGPKTFEILDKLEEEDRDALLRSCVQYFFGNIFRDIPKYLVIPESCYFCDIVNTASKIESSKPKEDFEYVLNFKEQVFDKVFKTSVFRSPPKSIKKLIKKVANSKPVIDLDLDYVYEFKDYCFTQPPRLDGNQDNPSIFGSLYAVTKVIQKVKPQLIILSEVFPSAINDSTGPVKSFLNWLEKRGYSVEMGTLFEKDEEGIMAMKKADCFYSIIIPKAMDNVETHFSSNSERLKEGEEMFVRELKKYYLIE